MRSPPPGAAPADVTLSVRRVGAEIEVAVADHGPGIAAADRLRVFGRFVRLEGARSRPGSGPRPVAGGGGCAHAWRRGAARRQCAGPARRARFAGASRRPCRGGDSAT